MLPVEVMVAMGTQWRSGMSGLTGLDYASLPVVLRLLGVARAQWRDLFADIRIMEKAVLDELRDD